MSRIPLMAGNWKMNLDHLEATATVQRLHWALQDANFDFNAVEVAVLPPFTDLRSVQTLVDADKMSIVYGGQDVSINPAGAYTGEISARMLVKLGCKYVVVGHSERRQFHGETDKLIGGKAMAAVLSGITPIVCVGEALAIRKRGEHVAYTLAQIDAVFGEMAQDLAPRAVIAYEPIWAIGTGEVATPADAQEVCGAIRERLASLYGRQAAWQMRILYGGSVKASNVASIMAEADVDGGLVGGASLDPAEFAKICRFAEHIA
ncbi:MAG: triose-phosphate isomerase [Bifidobacteriaceae bacterium]|jgi:triosephosphate isomerase|nr:triose-phosphate isomerase [Bifidobacteriaceae bacterium]